MDPLYVVTCIANPIGYRSRYELYRRFRAHMQESSNVITCTVELAYGDFPHHLDAYRPTEANIDVKLRGDRRHVYFIKEALNKVAVQHLPADAKYVAWFDADIHFLRPDWADQTLAMLQQHVAGQPWRNSVDLDDKWNVVNNEWGQAVDRSFCAAWFDGKYEPSPNYQPTKDGRSHYGYAWAMRKEAYDAIGGFPDWVVIGAADYWIAFAFAGILRKRVYELWPTLTPGYRRRLLTLADLCDRHIAKNIGYVEGTLTHEYHGLKARRGYLSRIVINDKAKFDPDHDLVTDWQGLPAMTGQNHVLRDELYKYFLSRKEDDPSP